MKRLLVIGNPFQLMMALFIHEKVFANEDITDILIFKSISGHEEYADRLKDMHLFRKVILIHETEPKGRRFRKALELIRASVGHAEKMSYITGSELVDSDYDEVWYYNYCPWFYGIYDLILAKDNKKVEFVSFMESVFTYTYLRNDELIPIVSPKEKLIQYLRKRLGRWVFYPYTGKVYVQYPDMTDCNPERDIHLLPPLTPGDATYIKKINRIFSTPSLTEIPHYIFMASSLEIDGFGSGETDLILQIANIVGKDNIIVKLHPRDKRGIIESFGIRVMESSSVCWEAIHLSNNLDHNVFITVASASILNYELFVGQELNAYYLYPLISDMTQGFRQYCVDSVGKTIDIAHKSGKAINTHVIHSLGDLQNI